MSRGSGARRKTDCDYLVSEDAPGALDGPAEQFFLTMIEILLRLFVSATFAYYCSLLLHLPARLLWVPFLLIAGLLSVGSFSHWKSSLQQSQRDRGFLLLTVSIGAMVGIFTLFTSRPDGDDVQLFHRSLLQLQHLEQPFFLTESIYDIDGLPLAAIGLLPSYEPVVAAAAHILGLDPLFVFHNLSPFLCSIGWVMLSVLLYRQFGLDRTTALLATLVAFFFLLSDGNLHRSFGNVTFVRLWQGKVILWTLCIPLLLLLAVRYLEHPTRSRLFAVFLATIAASGLSATGLFLAPALLAAIGPAYLLAVGVSLVRSKHVAFLNFASVYSLILLVLMTVDMLPNYDLAGFYSTWPSSWSANVELVISNAREWVRDLCILLVLPLVCLPQLYGRFLALLTVVLGVLYVNPWVGPLILTWLTPGSYWRLLYVFPLPLCAGMTVLCLQWSGFTKWQISARIGALVLVMATVVAAHQHSVFIGVRLKAPTEYRFPPDEYAFSQSILARIENRHILAPEAIISVLPLLKPDVTLEAARSAQTVRNFATIGKLEEGQRRVAAQELVTTCVLTSTAQAAFLQSVRNGVDAVIVRHCGEMALPSVIALLQSQGRWSESERSHGYVLMLRKDEKVDSPTPQ